MLKAMIRLHWKGSWHLVVALAVAALALPIVSVRNGWQGSAVILAVALWASDRRGHHIYALLLPIPRWRYVLLRYLAGLVLLLPVVLALWLGAMIATLSLDLPPGLRQFPHALAAKFALALVLLFGLAFAIAAASRRALGIGMRLVGLFLAVHIAVILLSPRTNLVWTVVTALSTWPGPFAPLGGRWMLIDV